MLRGPRRPPRRATPSLQSTMFLWSTQASEKCHVADYSRQQVAVDTPHGLMVPNIKVWWVAEGKGLKMAEASVAGRGQLERPGDPARADAFGRGGTGWQTGTERHPGGHEARRTQGHTSFDNNVWIQLG